MVKLFFCLRRKPGMSREEFQRYWREHHAPLVARHAETLGILRYVQAHSLDDELSAAVRAGGPDPYDGVAELWFELPEPSEAVDAAGRALYEDEATFIDHSRSPLFLAEENVVIEGDG